MMEENTEEIIKARKENVLAFLKTNQSLLFYIGLIAVIIFGGVYIRTAINPI